MGVLRAILTEEVNFQVCNLNTEARLHILNTGMLKPRTEGNYKYEICSCPTPGLINQETPSVTSLHRNLISVSCSEFILWLKSKRPYVYRSLHTQCSNNASHTHSPQLQLPKIAPLAVGQETTCSSQSKLLCSGPLTT